MSQMRIHSAGRIEAERANWALRDSVLRLGEELTFTKLQLSKVTNEFETLVLLVKRAWSGDSTASTQVAKLIGVASPDYQIQSSSGQMVIKVKPKSRPLNNWAKLTIGLLSYVSKSEKAGDSESQSLYLSQRKTYLGEQMATDEVAKRPAFLRSRSSSFSDLSGQARSTKLQSMTGKTEKSFTRRPSCGQLYRPSSHKTILKENDQTYSEVSYVNRAGLFELDDLLVTADPRQRPPSGLRQRVVGSFQDKPRSAVYARGERPLKYETTRPVSTHQVKDKPRGQSAKASRLKLRELLRQNNVFDDEVRAEELEEMVERKRNISPISTCCDEEEGTVTKTDNPELAKLRSRIEKLDSVVELDKELNNMARMEDDFRRKAVELQKRLGIDINGMVL